MEYGAGVQPTDAVTVAIAGQGPLGLQLLWWLDPQDGPPLASAAVCPLPPDLY